MTSAQLAQMLVRRTPWGAPSELPIADQSALVNCMDQAFQAWYENANATHVALPQNRQLRGQITLSATVTDGSTAIELISPPSWIATEGIGSTVRIGSDPRYNRLLSLTSLQMPYSGGSGIVSVVMNHDCGQLGGDTVSVCSNVNIHYNNHAFPLTNGAIPLQWSGDGYNLGRPERYAIEPISPGSNSTPAMVIRVWPLVTLPAVLTFEMAKHFSLGLPDVLSATPLPFPEDVASGIIYPIALAYAMGEKLLVVDAEDKKDIRENAADARKRIQQRTMNPVTDLQWIGTPASF